MPLELVPALPLDEKKVVLRRATLELTPGAVVNLGVGMAAGVGNIANEEKISDRIMLTVDPGIFGGVPLSGYGFGASLNYVASIDHATQFDFIDGGGLDIACLGFAECDGDGNVNASRFSGRVAGCGGFINISQNSKKVVFLGTFTSGGLKTNISNGELHILEEGKYPKFVESVGQVTFSGERAGREGRNVTYVTERCVLVLRENGLELTEVAPGVDIDKEILDLLPFAPLVDDPRRMEKGLFHAEVLDLRHRLSDIGIEDRISYNSETNTLFLDFSGMRVNTSDDIARIQIAVEGTLQPLGQRVYSIVNYDSFWVEPDVADEYLDLVRHIESKYYLKVSRYTTNGFMRIKLSRGLENRHISSDVHQTYIEAKESLEHE